MAVKAGEVVVSRETVEEEENSDDDVVKWSVILVLLVAVVLRMAVGRRVRWTRERYGGICLQRLWRRPA